MKGTYVIAAVLAIAIVGTGVWWMSRGPGAMGGPAMHGAAGSGEIVVPELGPVAAAGEEAFAENCARCHGAAAGGTDQGPPLIHPIYEPGHHADLSFVMAARQGARAHHWSFGDMPPVPGVSDREIEAIIAYVRQVQRANGIR